MTKEQHAMYQNSPASKKLIKMAKVIVWDEAPMGHNDLIEALDRLLQDLMGNNLPFGGEVAI